MSNIPAVTGKKMISALKKAGFTFARIKGSHHFLILITIIQSLSKEERQMFEEKLFFDGQEISTKDIMNLVQNSHSLDFLNSELDIYTLEDGEPI